MAEIVVPIIPNDGIYQRDDELHNILADLNNAGQNVLDVIPMPLPGQNREEYVIMANLHVQPMMENLPQAIENVAGLMKMAVVGRPRYELLVPELIEAFRASGQAVLSAIPGAIAVIALYKFGLMPEDAYQTIIVSFTDTVKHIRQIFIRLINVTGIIQQEKHAERHPDFPLSPYVELLPDAPAVRIMERIAAMRVQEEAIIAHDIAQGREPDYTLLYAVGGLVVVGVLTGGLAYAFGFFGATAAAATTTTAAAATTTAATTTATVAASSTTVFSATAALTKALADFREIRCRRRYHD